MADTKKEHYVPRCYLKNFILENDKIKIFDKFKMQVREQRIMDVAMENYFYDIDFEELFKQNFRCSAKPVTVRRLIHSYSSASQVRAAPVSLQFQRLYQEQMLSHSC